MRPFRSTIALLTLTLLMMAGCRSAGEFGSEPEQLVKRSEVVFKGMMSDTQYPGLVDLASRAKAIVIVPNLMRAGFFLGGRFGNAVMLVRDEAGTWSPPAFYTLGGVNFGLQVGAQTSELIITVMSERGLNAILDRQVTLGGDAGLAVGELGKGVQASTGIGYKADMYAFARSEGIYVGVSVDGSVISPRHLWNQQMYGSEVAPRSILIDRSVSSTSPAVSELIASMP